MGKNVLTSNFLICNYCYGISAIFRVQGGYGVGVTVAIVVVAVFKPVVEGGVP